MAVIFVGDGGGKSGHSAIAVSLDMAGPESEAFDAVPLGDGSQQPRPRAAACAVLDSDYDFDYTDYTLTIFRARGSLLSRSLAVFLRASSATFFRA